MDTIIGWDCGIGTDEEDHDWEMISGDRSVGEGDVMRCSQCGKEREPTDDDYAKYNDDPWI